ncbi:MAG: SH3 domain-containing protein [Planctomycetes bacterium]|nr:SH3 domain-containing protein [Planctomycetota bacterium]
MNNFSLRLLFSITVIVLFSVTAFSDVVADEEYVGKCTGNDVRIRASASLEAPIIGNIRAMSGDKFVIVGTQGDWYKIQLPEFISVWISRNYVKAEPGKIDGIVTGDNVNIRSASKTSSSVVDKANKGTKVEIMGANNDWFMIIPPKEATGWISGKYIEKLGLVHNYLGALKEERNRYLKRAAAYYESQGLSDISKVYQSLVKKVDVEPEGTDDAMKIKEAETKQFNILKFKYNQANFDRDSADIASLKSLAEEIRIFAENCTSDVKQLATNLYNEAIAKIKKIKEHQDALARMKVEEDIGKQKEENKVKILKEINIRLMRKIINKYVAMGVIVDEQLESGETVYYLAVDNKNKYRLVTIVPNLNLRDYWRREVGIVGKIVYDEDELYPIVLCESVQVFDK